MLRTFWQGSMIALLAAGLVVSGCKKKSKTGNDNSSSVTKRSVKQAALQVFSHRHYPADKKLFKLFTKKTGIPVVVTQNKADELMKRMQIQGKNSKADVLITVDAGRLVRAEQKGLLQPVSSKTLEERIPANLRDPKGHWFGLTRRARVIVYAKDRVKPSELSTYEALTDKKWKGRVLIRSSNNIYNQSLLASLIVALGEEKAKAWAKGMVANFARSPKGNDRDQMKAIAAKKGDVAVVNTYYVGKMVNSKKKASREVVKSLGVFFPNQKDRGAHVNVSGAGVAKYARNKEAAIKFIEFLASEEAQKVFAKANYEYPVNPKVKASKLVQSWGSFKGHKINLRLLGVNNKKAVALFDAVGWR